jgi:GNAT superfamily N-acetyltransferase
VSTQVRELLRETYGHAPDEAELEWWFERNPVAPSIVAVAEGEGATTLSLHRVLLEGEERIAAFIVHAVTVPSARGRGTFSRLELENEERAAALGASVVLGFTTEQATRVLLGRHGWEELARPRVWVRPRVFRSGRKLPELPSFSERDAAELADGESRIAKDVAYLEWRYRQSPRRYGRVDGRDGEFAVVGIGRRGGAVCELAGGTRTLRRAARAIDSSLVYGLPGPRRTPTFLKAAFVPTPWRLHFVGKRLDPEAPLPRDWRLELGDLDFF